MIAWLSNAEVTSKILQGLENCWYLWVVGGLLGLIALAIKVPPPLEGEPRAGTKPQPPGILRLRTVTSPAQDPQHQIQRTVVANYPPSPSASSPASRLAYTKHWMPADQELARATSLGRQAFEQMLAELFEQFVFDDPPPEDYEQ